jgi:hypothetical protein
MLELQCESSSAPSKGWEAGQLAHFPALFVCVSDLLGGWGQCTAAWYLPCCSPPSIRLIQSLTSLDLASPTQRCSMIASNARHEASTIVRLGKLIISFII